MTKFKIIIIGSALAIVSLIGMRAICWTIFMIDKIGR